MALPTEKEIQTVFDALKDETEHVKGAVMETFLRAFGAMPQPHQINPTRAYDYDDARRELMAWLTDEDVLLKSMYAWISYPHPDEPGATPESLYQAYRRAGIPGITRERAKELMGGLKYMPYDKFRQLVLAP
jgi:hypothetical protein